MDLLCAAYGTTSDEEADDPATSCPAAAKLAPVAPPPSKRLRREPYPYLPPPPLPRAVPQPLLPNEALQLASLGSGRYVSKRERALLAASRAPVDSASQLPPPAAAEFGSPGEHSRLLFSPLEAKIV
jgi:WD repeat-containing protein 25